MIEKRRRDTLTMLIVWFCGRQGLEVWRDFLGYHFHRMCDPGEQSQELVCGNVRHGASILWENE
jgi:hypothetical protein